MTMTSGFACNDSDEKSPGNEDQMESQKTQPDWYRYTLDLPLLHDPGGQEATYCSAGFNLVGGVVQRATGRWLPDIFQQDFAKPLQITEYHLNLTPTGDAYMGGGLYMRPRDLLKLGQLYLNEGVWNRHRVVSKEWVDASTQYRSHLEPYLGVEHQYGYGWHIYHLTVADHVYKMYGAGGNGGQLVLVIPDLDMVIGFTGGAYGEFQKWYPWQTQLVPEYIIQSARP
jgi:CubicO group peptidase (beta-lactamase class C family)